jgi:hypothetical protein
VKGCKKCWINGELYYPCYDRAPLVSAKNFKEDPKQPGFGWYTACPACGAADEDRVVTMEDGPIAGGYW